MNQKIRKICEKGGKKWCVLHHPDSGKIAKIFKKKYTTLDEGDDAPKLPYTYYIPADDFGKEGLKATDSNEYADYNPMLDKNSFRRELSEFIFVLLTGKETDAMLKAPWAQSLSHSIGVYRDSNGKPIQVSGRDILDLSDMIRQQSFRVAISQSGPAYQEIQDGEWVKIVNGPMKGKEGEVTGFVEHDGQVLLTITIEMFGLGYYREIPGFNIFNVRHCEKKDDKEENKREAIKKPAVEVKKEALEVSLLTSLENRIIEYLCHLHGKQGSQQRNEEDHKQLRMILRYAKLTFPTEEETAKFKALMLLCAYLLKDEDMTDSWQQQVEQMLDGRKAPTSHLDCYLMTILFIVTHQPELRRQTKLWRQSHPDCPLSVCRFHSIAKHIRC